MICLRRVILGRGRGCFDRSRGKGWKAEEVLDASVERGIYNVSLYYWKSSAAQSFVLGQRRSSNQQSRRVLNVEGVSISGIKKPAQFIVELHSDVDKEAKTIDSDFHCGLVKERYIIKSTLPTACSYLSTIKHLEPSNRHSQVVQLIPHNLCQDFEKTFSSQAIHTTRFVSRLSTSITPRCLVSIKRTRR
jgi:hypothetical protein